MDLLQHPPEFIKLLANDVRWGLLKALTDSDHQVNELVTQLQQPMNLVSYHLKKMRDDQLVTTRRSEADGRDVYYTLDLQRLHHLYHEAGAALHPSLGQSGDLVTQQFPHRRVLFVCTHNSARSQIAEGLLRILSEGKLEGFSAGSHPTTVHPLAICTMDALGVDIRQQRSQSLSEFMEQSFDYVITVCDKAREVCPAFGGTGVQLHWGFADPVTIADLEVRAQAFEKTALRLKSRIEYFLTTLHQHESEQ